MKLDTSLAVGNLAEAEPSVVAMSSVGGTVSRLDDVIARRLLDAHVVARKRRLRISGLSMTTGGLKCAGSNTPEFIDPNAKVPLRSISPLMQWSLRYLVSSYFSAHFVVLPLVIQRARLAFCA